MNQNIKYQNPNPKMNPSKNKNNTFIISIILYVWVFHKPLGEFI